MVSKRKKINWSKRRINNRKRDGLSNYLQMPMAVDDGEREKK
jgi:hypothetical protein